MDGKGWKERRKEGRIRQKNGMNENKVVKVVFQFGRIKKYLIAKSRCSQSFKFILQSKNKMSLRSLSMVLRQLGKGSLKFCLNSCSNVVCLHTQCE